MEKKNNRVRKAVIAAAGYGTRFLPATKVQPKEMLPLIDKPIIQYLVEEAVASGITESIIVNRAGTHIIEDHFDSSFEIETKLENSHKEELLKRMKEIPRMANFFYARQTKDYPYGNASPMLAARAIIGNEPFAYMFGDDLVMSKKPCLKQLIEVYEKHQPDAILGVQETPWEEVDRYGTVRYRRGTKINQIDEVLEKLPREQAPSNMAQFGRFIMTPKVLRQANERWEKKIFGKDGELWVADILNDIAKKGKVIAQPIEGHWMTTGDPLRYLKATVEFALAREDIGVEFRDYLKSLKV